MAEVSRLLIEHLHDHYSCMAHIGGVRSARKHIGWYVRSPAGRAAFRAHMNIIEDCAAQLAAVQDFLTRCKARWTASRPLARRQRTRNRHR